MQEKPLLQTVDDAARRQARDLVRTARHASLGTLRPADGWPLTSRVSLATDVRGAPVFLISRLSSHFGALEADARASLLVGEPGRGDPLAHPRMTVIGWARMATEETSAGLRARFLARHPKAALYVDFGDFAFWHLEVERASLNGGFGKAFELCADDLLISAPIGLVSAEAEAVERINATAPDDARAIAEKLLGLEAGPWHVTGIDAEGLDLAMRDETARLRFDAPIANVADLQPTLAALARRAREAA